MAPLGPSRGVLVGRRPVLSLSAPPPAAARSELPVRKRNVRLVSNLEVRLDAAAAAAGVSANAWICRAIEKSLGAGVAPAPAHAPASQVAEVTGDRRVHLRAPAADVSRWEAEALEYGLTLNRYVQLQMSVTPQRGRRVAEAVEILGAASVEMARIGRNLNQVARSVNTMPGQTTALQRRTLMETCTAVDVFADQITAVCSALNLKLGRRRARPIRAVVAEVSAE